MDSTGGSTLTGFYEKVASMPGGARALSAARLRYEVLKVLHRGLDLAQIPQTELARRLGVRKSAVNQVFRGDGNLRISTLAEYLHELGLEIRIAAVPLGTQRAEAVADIETAPGAAGRNIGVYTSRTLPAAARPGPESLDAYSWHRAATGANVTLTSVG
jgi:transcriptional regulator with XRE-family HTH domain